MPESPETATFSPSAAARLRPLVRMRVRAALRAELKKTRRGQGNKAKLLTAGEQQELLAQVGAAEVDAAVEEAEARQEGRATGPLLDFLTSAEFIQLVVSILLKFLGL